MSSQTLTSGSVRPAGAAGSRLRGGKLAAARLAWVAATSFAVIVFVRDLPARSAVVMQYAAANAPAFATLGLSPEAFHRYIVALDILMMVSFATSAIVIAACRSDDWVVLFISMTSFMYGGASAFLHTLMRSDQVGSVADTLLLALAMSGTIICVYIFPHGRFVPRWTAPLSVVLLLWAITWPWVPALNPFTYPPAVTGMLIGPWYIAGAVASLYRYSRLSNRVEQIQMKWVVFATAVTIVAWQIYSTVALFWPLSQQAIRQVVLTHVVLMTVVLLSQLLVPLAFVIAVLRYRLWDINVIISRTLVYVPLTAILAGLYSACITLFQKLFVGATGQQSDAAIVLTTLVLVSVFTPIKEALAKAVERHFKEPDDPRRYLRVFTDRLRSVLDVLDGGEIARQGLQNAMIAFSARGGAVYLQEEGSPRLVHASDSWSGDSVLSCPMCHENEEVGLLVLDRRRGGQSYSEEDRELLRHYAGVMARAIRLAQRVER